jgi:gluconolactonase
LICKCLQLTISCRHLKQADGIVLLASMSPFGTQVLSSYSQRALPIVIGCETISPELSGFPAVHIDNVAAAQEATDYLLGLGHRKIAFIFGQDPSLLTRDRELGYRPGFAQFFLPLKCFLDRVHLNLNDIRTITRSRPLKLSYSRLSTLLLILLATQVYADKPGSDPNLKTTLSVPQAGSIHIEDARLKDLIDTDAELEVLATGFQWSEGPVWMETQQQVVFSDVPANIAYSWSEKSGLQTYLEPAGYTGNKPRKGGLGSNGLALDPQGRLILCQHGDRRVARMISDPSQPAASYTTLADNYQGKRFNSPNDLVYDSTGNLYFTDPPYGLESGADDPAREMEWSGVYRLSPEGEVRLLYTGLSRPNGIGLSIDEKTLYVANSDPDEATWSSFRIKDDGSLDAAVVFHDATTDVKTKPGLPDGLKVDGNGNIFATGPGGIFIFNADTVFLGIINTGEPTANLAFNVDDSAIYITANDKLMRLQLR